MWKQISDYYNHHKKLFIWIVVILISIIVVMFIGRIGMLNILIGFLRQTNNQFYEYPKENILIN